MRDTLYFYICGRICKSVTVKAVYTGRYERCRACGSQALYKFSRPVTTDEGRAVHAKGVALNPFQPPPPPFICVRCGLDVTGKQLPRYRADGKVCRDCYFAEDEAAEPILDRDARRMALESREQ